MHNKERLKAIFALITVALLWGIASVVIKGTLEYLPPMTFLYYRFLMVLPITLPWYIYYLKKNPIRRKDIIPLTIFGFMATTLYLGLVFLGFERTTAIDGNLLGTISPLFIILFGALLLKENITKREKIGLGLAVVGTIVTVIQPLLEGHAFAYDNTVGNLIILVASITWSLFVLFSKKNFRHFSPVLITLHGSVVAAVTFAVLAFFEQGMHLPNILELGDNFPAFWGVFYMAFISYVLAYILYEYGMSKMEISEGSLFTYLQPLFATPLAVALLHEEVTIFFITGAAIIFAGVVLSQWK